jgi:hypothetical protein
MVAQRGAVAAREDGGELARVSGRSAMAEEVDATVERMEATGLDATVDGVRANAHRAELASGDDAVLARSERGDHSFSPVSRAGNPTFVGCSSVVVGSTAYMPVNPTLDFGAPSRVGFAP